MSSPSANGIATMSSPHSFDETVERIKSALQTRGIKLFAEVDHSGEAAAVGMTMPPTKLLIFGNPRGGTSLMLASPSIAIDLPLKLLIAENAGGVIQVSWNTPAYLQTRHALPSNLDAPLHAVEALAQAALAGL